eukprot:scaffold10995_cov112-Isochrysis_galbana.AAC.9
MRQRCCVCCRAAEASGRRRWGEGDATAVRIVYCVEVRGGGGVRLYILADCPHYLTGKCENFKIGGVCPFTHTGWDNSMIGRCAIACDLPADINDTEQCINGVSCLYNHSMYAPPPHGPWHHTPTHPHI